MLEREDEVLRKHILEIEAANSPKLILGPVSGGKRQSRVSVLDIYADALESGTLVMKCRTSAVISVFGDIGAQGIQQACGCHRIWYNNKVSTVFSDGTESKGHSPYAY